MATQARQQSVNQKKSRTQMRPRPASRQRAVAPVEGLKRKRPGTTGEGHYYHIEIQSRRNFQNFRTQDIGRKGHIQRVAGQRPNGSWETVKWLIAKKDAHLEDGRLVADTGNAKKVLAELGSEPTHIKGDRFKALLRPGAPKALRSATDKTLERPKKASK